MQTLKAKGYDVVAIGPNDGYEKKLLEADILHRAIPFVGSSLNPISELATVVALYRLFKAEQIDIVLSYTPKGNIYGAIASAITRCQIIANVSGLGQVFVRQSTLTWLVKRLYCYSFRRAIHVFFQNREDMGLFIQLKLIHESKAEHIPGSGVDLKRFSLQYHPYQSFIADENKEFRKKRHLVFLLVARLLWDKGVGEYVEAARKIQNLYPGTRFQLLGHLDSDNPGAIPKAQILDWEKEGITEYLGKTDDVLPFIRDADCVVLPSYYREGVPRSLLEAASMGKPLITTDAIGCRDTVDHGITGFLCSPRDSKDLAETMIQLIELPEAELYLMGRRGREKMEREFDENFIIKQYLKKLDEVAAYLSEERGDPSLK